MSFRTLARNDARLQVRQGFYGAYAIVVAVYLVLLRQVPESARAVVATLVVFSDPAVFGFFCVGALLLLERDEGVHAPLFTTPARPAAYVLAKTATLALLALVTGFAVALGAGTPFARLRLAAGVALTAVLFVHLGIVLGCHVRSFNRFALGGGLGLLALSLPLLPYFGLAAAAPLALLPSYASLVLIGGAFGLQPAVPQSDAFAAVWLIAWGAAAGHAARLVVERRLPRGAP